MMFTRTRINPVDMIYPTSYYLFLELQFFNYKLIKLMD